MSAALALVTFFLLSGPLLPNGPAQNPANPAQVIAASAQILIPGPTVTPTAGSLSGGMYSNEYFHFSYRLPQAWESDAQSHSNPFETTREYREGPGNSDIQDGSKKYLLLSASERGTNNSVQVVAYDADGETSITSGDVALAEVGALRSLGGTASGISETTIGGRTFSIGRAQINGEMRGRSQTVFAGVAAVKDGSYVLTWSFFADSASHLEELMGTLDSIRFEQ